jgi:hypothetical protein
MYNGTTGKKRFDAFNRDVGTIKRQGGKTCTKGTSIDLQLCVDLPMKTITALNHITFKFIPHDFVQN